MRPATVAFSILALLLAIAGLYGVVSRGVIERIRELGIRVVLGATRRDLIGLVMRQGPGRRRDWWHAVLTA
jgi:ABC-type antimicrobial peptide transport system permease subunit